MSEGRTQWCSTCRTLTNHKADGHPASVKFEDWETASIEARCDDERCLWNARGGKMLATDEAAAEHVRESCHSVTVVMESRKTVRAAGGAS
jgi:hypothetical protein